MSQEMRVLAIIGAITVVMVIGGVLLLSGGSSSKTAAVDSQVLSRQNVHQTESSGSARVTVVEFADFQCPACAQAHLVLKSVMPDYTGRVNLVYRHFPLPQHGNAILAATAAEAANKQGKFWQMYDLLYGNQTSWSESDKARESFVHYATQLGLNQEQFSKDLDSGEFTERITIDTNDGRALGVNSTPTFYINGVKYTGGLTPEVFRRAFDAALQQ